MKTRRMARRENLVDSTTEPCVSDRSLESNKGLSRATGILVQPLIMH